MSSGALTGTPLIAPASFELPAPHDAIAVILEVAVLDAEPVPALDHPGEVALDPARPTNTSPSIADHRRGPLEIGGGLIAEAVEVPAR